MDGKEFVKSCHLFFDLSLPDNWHSEKSGMRAEDIGVPLNFPGPQLSHP